MKELLIQPTKEKFSEYLDFAENYGFKFEIIDFTLLNIIDNEEEVNNRVEFYINNKSLGKNFSMHGVFIDMYVNSPDEQIRNIARNRIIKNFQIEKKIGVDNIVLHTNYIPLIRDERYLNNWIDSCAYFFGQQIDKYDISVYMENMFDFNPLPLRRLVDKINSNKFKVCFDTGHCNVHSIKSMKEWFDVLNSDIGYIHLNDNNSVLDEEIPPGQGNIDWNLFNSMIKKYDLDPHVVFEVADIPDFKESIDYLKTNKIFPYNK